MVDSGASICVVDAALAERRGLERAGRGSVSGAGAGRVAADTIRGGVQVEVGGEAAECERTVAIDLSGLTEPLRQRVDGILGFDFLRRYVVEIDYAERRLRLHDPRSYRYASTGRRIPLQFRNRQPYVTARISVGHGPPVERTLLVDTGSGDAVDDSLLLQSPRPTRTVTGGVGLGSTYQVTSGFLDAVELGGFRFTDVPGVAPGPSLVGGAVLRRFTVILDYGRQEMILEPNRHFADRFGPS
ncbi:MAG TPA: aspartyl protease family protein [Longimicrobium sp.]|nr:aspartyl protease family protein [Longimicrobium sp.]